MTRASEGVFSTPSSTILIVSRYDMNGGLHATDVSNASRTRLMNLKTLDWDKLALDALGISAQMFAQDC